MSSIIFKPLILFSHPISLLESSRSYLQITHCSPGPAPSQPKIVVLLSVFARLFLPQGSSRLRNCTHSGICLQRSSLTVSSRRALLVLSASTLFLFLQHTVVVQLWVYCRSLHPECEFYDNQHSVSFAPCSLSHT